MRIQNISTVKMTIGVVFQFRFTKIQCSRNVADPDPDPEDPYVFGPPGPDPLVRGPDPDPSIIEQK